MNVAQIVKIAKALGYKDYRGGAGPDAAHIDINMRAVTSALQTGGYPASLKRNVHNPITGENEDVIECYDCLFVYDRWGFCFSEASSIQRRDFDNVSLEAVIEFLEEHNRK